MTVPPSPVHHRRAEALAVAILLLPLVLAAPALIAGWAWSPAANLYTSYPWQGLAADAGPPNPALSDVTQWFHPALLWSGTEIRSGRFPLWVPHAYGGAPFFANPQAALLFPLTWLAWLLPPTPALTLITALKLVGAGLAMYWFLRVGLGLCVTAALIGAVGFEFSTTLVGWVGWAFGSTIMFVPLLFGAVERLRERGRWHWMVVLALVVALDLFAGYPQSAFHALLAAGAWALARARSADRWFLVRCLTGAVLGAGLAAVQLLPFLEYAGESTVLAYRRQWMPAYSVPPAAAITLLMPYAFGSGASSWGRWQFNIVSTYVGLVPLLLAPLGALVGRPRPASRFFLGFVLVVAAVHYGLPGAGEAASLPGLALGTNLRLMPYLLFAIAALGALGVDALARGELPIRWWPIRSWFIFLAVSGFAWVAAHHGVPGPQGLMWPLWVQFSLALTGLTAAALMALRWGTAGGSVWGPALVALQVISVVPPAFAYLPSVSGRWLYPETPAIAWVRAQPGHARMTMPGHVGVLYDLAEPHGYDGLTPRRIVDLVGSVGTGSALVRGYSAEPAGGRGQRGGEPGGGAHLAGGGPARCPSRDAAPRRSTDLASPDARLRRERRPRVRQRPRAAPRVSRLSRALRGRRHRAAGDPRALRRPASRGAAGRVHDADAERTADLRVGRDPCLCPGARAGGDPRRLGGVSRVDRHVVSRVAGAGGRAGNDALARRPCLPGRVGSRRPARGRVPVRAAVPEGGAPGECAERRRGPGVARARPSCSGVGVRALVIVVLMALAVAAEAALPAPPFTLDVIPSRVGAGQPVRMQITPRGDAGEFDVYLMWEGSEEAAFLTPQGAWSVRPVAFRPRLPARGAPITFEWVPTPPGDVPLALVVVPPGVDSADPCRLDIPAPGDPGQCGPARAA